jgi:hypothetical protein
LLSREEQYRGSAAAKSAIIISSTTVSSPASRKTFKGLVEIVRARDKAPNKTDGNDTDGLAGGFARILPGAKQVCQPARL